MRTKYTLIALFVSLFTMSGFAQSSITFNAPTLPITVVKDSNVWLSLDTIPSCSIGIYQGSLQFPTNSSYIIVGPLSNTTNKTITLHAYNATGAPKNFELSFSNSINSFGPN